MVRRSFAIHASAALAVTFVAVLAGACASTGGVPRPFPTPGGVSRPAPDWVPSPTEAPGPPGTDEVDAYALVGTALSLRGVTYRNGGVDPNGFDCSGFTQYVFAQHGVGLPREVRDQFQLGKSVPPADIAPGDLLFFTTTASGPTHVAIAIGSDQFVHAPSSTGVVRVERLGAGYWSARFLGARRLTQL